MRRVQIAFLACVSIVVCAWIAAGPSPSAAAPVANAAADRLIGRERAMMATLDKHDLAGFRKYVKSGSWSVDENGGMGIDEFLQSWDKINIENSRLSDEKVIVLDPNAALVTYRLEQKGSFNGTPFPPVVYATTAWVRSGGTWQAVFHQESTAAKR